MREDEPVRTKCFQIRLKPAERERLEREAQAASMTATSFARNRIFGRTVQLRSNEGLIRELSRCGHIILHAIAEGALGALKTEAAVEAIVQALEAAAAADAAPPKDGK
jgi:hypothetical protein